MEIEKRIAALEDRLGADSDPAPGVLFITAEDCRRVEKPDEPRVFMGVRPGGRREPGAVFCRGENESEAEFRLRVEREVVPGVVPKGVFNQ
ncbi:MAG: hypothetical protein JW913_16815 [Chitinispirillaceae bacterium]|nr:hypothetical protein [Chitinispirillaceae bacterium]